MRRILLAILILAVLGVLALIGIAIFTDLPPPQREIELPIESQ